MAAEPAGVAAHVSGKSFGALGRRALLPGLVLALLAAAGCLRQSHVAFRGDPAERLQFASLAATQPSWPPPDLVTAPGKPVHGHDVLKLYRPKPCGSGSDTEWGATAYLGRAQGPKRWVVVLPIWGSSTYPPNKIVRWLLTGHRGDSTSVLWIHGPDRLVRYDALEDAPTEEAFVAEITRSAACIDATARDVSAFVTWILDRPDTDPQRVGIVGCSIGAIVGSLVMGRDPRFAAGVFVMGGGHLDQILVHCYGSERAVLESVRAKFGWSAEDLARVVKRPLEAVDPVGVAGNIDPASVLYIDAKNDTCIPPSGREDLWQAMGEPERVTIGYGHKSSFLTMTFLGLDVTTRRIVHFLDRRLGVSPLPYAPRAATLPGADRTPGS